MPAMKNVRMKSQQKHFIALTKTRMKFQDGWTQSIKSFFKEIALRDSIRAFYACFFTGVINYALSLDGRGLGEGETNFNSHPFRINYALCA